MVLLTFFWVPYIVFIKLFLKAMLLATIANISPTIFIYSSWNYNSYSIHQDYLLFSLFNLWNRFIVFSISPNNLCLMFLVWVHISLICLVIPFPPTILYSHEKHHPSTLSLYVFPLPLFKILKNSINLELTSLLITW